MTVVYNPKLPEILANPYPVFRQLQDEDPVHWSDILNGWVLTRYAHVLSSLRDTRFSASRIVPRLDTMSNTEREHIGDLGDALSLWMVFMDPPDHTRLRTLVNKAFTPQVVERMRGRIAAIVDDLLARVEPHGQMDIIRDLAYPLPATVIAEMIGVPKDRLEQLKHWSDDIAGFAANALSTADMRQRAQRSMHDMTVYFRHLVGAHRDAPCDDIMSSLIDVEASGKRLREDEIVATCIFLLFAGHETTTNLIGNAILALLDHPEQWERLRHHPSLIPSAVEEFLRYDGPVQSVVRVAAEDIELDGKRIRQGERIFSMLIAADRDPRQFPRPDRLDVARQDNRHIAFGYGIHFCLGAPLARVEGQVALGVLTQRLRGVKLETDSLVWNDSLVLRGVKSLPVSFQLAV